MLASAAVGDVGRARRLAVPGGTGSVPMGDDLRVPGSYRRDMNEITPADSELTIALLMLVLLLVALALVLPRLTGGARSR